MSEFPDEKTDSIPTKTSAFCKGGCGCMLVWVLFIAAALVLPGGHVHGDPIGFVLSLVFLFLVGGGIALFVRWVYRKGFDAGRKQ
jgi:hypothetical protein